MLKVTLKKRFPGFAVDVDLQLAQSGVTAFFGHSGAGKTSIVNMISGLLRPDEGVVALKGRELFNSRKGIHVPPERRRIGCVFQEDRLFPHLSVRSNLMYGFKRAPVKDRYVEMDEVVELLGIEVLLDRRPYRLSGGEKQRVAIGRALLTSPDLLLLDEPLASLDNARKAEVLPFVARLAREYSAPILFISHDVKEVLLLAQQVVILNQGRAVEQGAVESLKDRLVSFRLPDRI